MGRAIRSDLTQQADEQLPAQVGGEVRCPRCGLPLERDPYWSRPYDADGQGHSDSAMRALLAELRTSGAVLEPSHSSPLRAQTG